MKIYSLASRTALAFLGLSSISYASSSSIGVGTWNWNGRVNHNWHNHLNWDFGDIFTDAPTDDIDPYIGPVVQLPSANYTIPHRPAVITEDFSSPSFIMANFYEGHSELTVTNGAIYTIRTGEGIVGKEPTYLYEPRPAPTGPIKPSILNLCDGELRGDWVFGSDSSAVLNICGNSRIQNLVLGSSTESSVVLNLEPSSTLTVAGNFDLGYGKINLNLKSNFVQPDWFSRERLTINLFPGVSYDQSHYLMGSLTNQGIFDSSYSGTTYLFNLNNANGILNVGKNLHVAGYNLDQLPPYDGAIRTIDGFIDNTNGVINLENSTLRLGVSRSSQTFAHLCNTVLHGGRLSSNNSTIDAANAFLDDIVLAGRVNFSTGAGLSGNIVNEGVVFTYGSILVKAGDTLILSGTGSVILDSFNGNPSIVGQGRIINESNEIKGALLIDCAEFTNSGSIVAEKSNVVNTTLLRQTRGITIANNTKFEQTSTGITIVKGELICANFAPKAGVILGGDRLTYPYNSDALFSNNGWIKGDSDFSGVFLSPGHSIDLIPATPAFPQSNPVGILRVDGDAVFSDATVYNIDFADFSDRGGIIHDLIGINGDLFLAGNLQIRIHKRDVATLRRDKKFIVATTRDFYIDGTQFLFQPKLSDALNGHITGRFLNMDANGRVATVDGEGSFKVTIMTDQIVLSDFRWRNDHFEDAADITGPTSQTTTNNQFATGELGEPEHINTAGRDSSLWWKWTAPADGTLYLDTNGSTSDTVLAAYTGDTITNLSPVAVNDDADEMLTSKVRFVVEGGTTYYIAVGTWDARGDISLNLIYSDVVQYDQSIEFTELPEQPIRSTFVLSADSTSGLPVGFEIFSIDPATGGIGSTTLASIDADGVTVAVGALTGFVGIKATQAGGVIEGKSYFPAEPVYRFFQIVIPITKALASSDTDGNGQSYVEEWMFGGDPDPADGPATRWIHVRRTGAQLRNILPEANLYPDSTEYPAFGLKVRRARQGVLILPQASDNLVFGPASTQTALLVETTVLDADYEQHTYVVVPTAGGPAAARAFLRLVLDYSALPE